MGVALMVATQAVDLRTYSTHGHYDAREMLSPATVPLYEAVRAWWASRRRRSGRTSGTTAISS